MEIWSILFWKDHLNDQTNTFHLKILVLQDFSKKIPQMLSSLTPITLKFPQTLNCNFHCCFCIQTDNTKAHNRHFSLHHSSPSPTDTFFTFCFAASTALFFSYQ